MIAISIEDSSMDLSVNVSVSGGYSLDVLHDMQQRVLECYRQTLIEKVSVMNAAAAAENEPTPGESELS